MAIGGNKIVVRLGLEGLKGFSEKLYKASKAMRKAGQNMKRNGEEISKMVTLPVVGIGAAAVATAAKFEKLQVSLNTLTGSAIEGEKAFKRLKVLSAGTPFQLEDLVKAQNTLMGFSLSSDEAFESVKMLGDIAAISGADMSRLSVTFGQAAAEGKVMTKDIREFINNGVPMVKLLADEMGVAESEIFDLASQGKITFDVLTSAFRKATSEGGMFADGMKKQAGTIGGLFSTLKDNVSILLADIGKAIVDAGLREMIVRVTDAARDAVKVFSNLSPETKKLIVVIAGLAAAIGPLLIVLGQAKIALAALGFTMSSFVTMIPTVAIVAFAAAIGTAIYGLTQFNDTIDVAAEKTKALDNVRKSAMDSIAGEIFNIENLTKVAKSENIAKEERIKAINELKRISPKYNDVLEGEKINVEKLTTATDELTDSMMNQAMVKAAQSQFEDLGAELINLESGAKKVGLSFSEILAAGAKGLVSSFSLSGAAAAAAMAAGKEATNNQEQAIVAVQAKMEALKTFIDGNKDLFKDFFGGGDGGGGGDGDGDGGGEPENLGVRDDQLDKLKDYKYYQEQNNRVTVALAKAFLNQVTPAVEAATDGLDKMGVKINESLDNERVLSFRDKLKNAFDDIGDFLKDQLDVVNEWMPAIQGLFSFWGQALDNKAAKQQRQYEEEMQRIQDSTMSEKKKEEAIAKLNEKRDKQERKLAREKAKRDKAVALFNAIIGVASQVAKVVGNPILAAIVAGIGAAQIAAIAAEPLPALAEGGLAYGPTMALVGDNTGARVDPEVISPLSKLKDMMGGQQDIRLSGAFRIQGQDLVLALEEANQIRVRR